MARPKLCVSALNCAAPRFGRGTRSEEDDVCTVRFKLSVAQPRSHLYDSNGAAQLYDQHRGTLNTLMHVWSRVGAD